MICNPLPSSDMVHGTLLDDVPSLWQISELTSQLADPRTTSCPHSERSHRYLVDNDHGLYADLLTPLKSFMGSPPPEPSIGPEASDTELLHWLKAGHTNALRILYQRYVRLIYTVAMRILDNSQEAEDLTQEIFVTFWQKGAYDPSRGSLSSYLCLITRSRALDRRRAKGSYQRFLSRYQQVNPGISNTSPFDQISASEREQTIRRALQDLPEAQRQVLELAYYEGFSQSEIAEHLQLPLGTVKTRSRQGLLKLRRLLGGILP